MQNKFFYNPSRNKIGAIIRTTDHADRFDVIQLAIDNLLLIAEITLIHIFIYKPEENSELRKKLIGKYGREKKRIEFVNVQVGNFYTDLLNFAIKEQTRRGIDYTLSVSPEAYEYITRENFDKILEATKNGALVVGLRIDEYSELIDLGYYSNAFAFYRNVAVDLADIWEINRLVKNEESSDIEFGMEEIYVIKRLSGLHGPESVAVVSPLNGKMNYLKDDKSVDWHGRVLKTKLERLKKMQSILNIDSEELKKLIAWI